MKRYIKEDIYGMSRIGTMSARSATWEIYVNTNDAGKIPHFHLRDIDDWSKFHTCIRIDSPEYFMHGSKHDTLSSKEKKDLNTFMNSSTRRPIFKEDGSKMNNWDYICMLWDDNNSDVQIDANIVQPDYTLLK